MAPEIVDRQYLAVQTRSDQPLTVSPQLLLKFHLESDIGKGKQLQLMDPFLVFEHAADETIPLRQLLLYTHVRQLPLFDYRKMLDLRNLFFCLILPLLLLCVL